MEKYFVKYAGKKLMYRGKDAIDALEKFKNRKVFGENLVHKCHVKQIGKWNNNHVHWAYVRCEMAGGKTQYVMIEQEM